LVNNLFKSIIELSFPDVVKYFFWACENQTGCFEKIDLKEYNRVKAMSKYKKDELINNKRLGLKDDGASSEDEIKLDPVEPEPTTIN
jgi:hypothetical protein